MEDLMNKALTRLRAKTDRELCILAEKQLEQTLTLAGQGRYRDAERAYDTSRRLLALLPEGQQARLEPRLAHARAVMEQPAAAVA
jgi:hypothetical protein